MKNKTTQASIDFLSEIQRAINYEEMAYEQRAELSKKHICFCLHQSIEFTFKSISKYLRGYVTKTHSLYMLNENIRECAPQFYKIFSEDRYLLILLDKLYSNSQFSLDDLVISEEILLNLFVKVALLHEASNNLINI
ncbi:MAG: hypothetical protein PW786_06800 [Arachidicoccus sp.]|nr:hypothetical protein [Arachidicoccus sp.]